VSPVRNELGVYIPEDGILRDRRENLKCYIALTGWALKRRYKLGVYIPEEGILHSHCHENIKSCLALTGWAL
jgi:hypothetical protein